MHTRPDSLLTVSHDKWNLMRKLEPNQQDVLKQAAGIDVLRPVRGQTTGSVRTNHFMMDLYGYKGSRVLYVYRIDGIPPDGTRAKKRTTMHTAIEKCAPLRSNKLSFATENISKIVAWIPLAEDASPGDEIAKIPMIDYDRRDYPSSQRTLSLIFEREIDLEELRKSVTGEDPTYSAKNEAIAALNLVFSKHVLSEEQGGFFAGKNRFFLMSSWEELDHDAGKVVFRGYFYTVRTTEGSLLLKVNTGMSVFYQPMTVADYLRNRDNDERDLVGVRVWINFPVQTLTKPNKLLRTILKGARRPFLSGTASSKCVNTSPTNPRAKVWFLAEDLWILPEQMYRPTIEGKLTSAMIKKACRTPKQNSQAIMSEGMPALGIEGKKRPDTLEAAGIRLRHQMITVPARLIAQPTLRFAQPPKKNSWLSADQRGVWKTDENLRLLDTSRSFASGPAFFLLPSFRRSNEEESMLSLIQNLYKHAFTLGFPAPGSAPTVFTSHNSATLASSPGTWRDDDIKSLVASAVETKPSLIVMALPQKDKVNLGKYSPFKAVLDQCYGLSSLCLCAARMQSSSKNRMEDSASSFAGYARNVGLELNLCLSNTNHSLTPEHFKDVPTNTAAETDTMILGADVIHPGMQSAEGTPSIAAVVGSVDGDYAKYLGSMRCQPFDPSHQSKELIEDGRMEALVMERLHTWKDVNGRFPTNIIYYRDGVGESQFSTLRKTEIPAITSAFARVTASTEQSGIVPKITAVVVTKRHNVRFYPNGSQSSTGNCLPGTVVDRAITSPHFFDFYLLSQHGLQGTARPTHYFVVENDIGFGSEALQDLTNSLCYTYGRSTTSVSYVPPAYYADHPCERGRCYVKDIYDGADRVKKMDVHARKAELDRMWGRGGRPDGNPWRESMDDKMF
ncbi:hypothetical protein LTR86_006022 [Recurvomyces mirabilis]|nr:hypothetical protein LTR86_006022 [Recurvomyces mirabilis]